ncbi:MAG TPA: SAM-dependent chlorinase/fluorinase [Candidatus Binataceae bacterium]|nr:SAM-dependent chlorinase/fluorinase [Candidatus Binataceae bacterium]
MPNRSRRTDAPIALLTDFGYRDHYAGVLHGVIASIAPAARVIDITHGVPAQSVTAGALLLRESWRYFPKRTIFVAVVDPGVGTSRRPIAIETSSGARFVGPDNGVLWLAAEQAGYRRAVELRAPRFRLPEVSLTFHGRDVFAPAAAHLWLGAPFKALGPALDSIDRVGLAAVEQSRDELRGTILYVDGFGNLISNIDRETFDRSLASFPRDILFVTIDGGSPIKLCDTYGDAPEGTPLALFGSFHMLEIAVRDGCAAERLAAGAGAIVTVQIKR